MHGREGATWSAAPKVWHELLLHAISLFASALIVLRVIEKKSWITLSLFAVVLMVDRVDLVQCFLGRGVLTREALRIQPLVLRADVFARGWAPPEHRRSRWMM